MKDRCKSGSKEPSFQGGQGGSLGQGGFRYKNADPIEYGLLKAYARENRKNMTQSESILWSQIKGRALGVTFLRQYIIGDYITDFACLDSKLVIEVDGGYHSEPRQVEDDTIRQNWLNHQGFKVIRFTNEEVECDIDNTVNKIKQALDPPQSSQKGESSKEPSFQGGQGGSLGWI